MSAEFETKFARELYALISIELKEHHGRVFSGSVLNTNSLDSTALAFARQHGHYEALDLCLTLMRKVEKKLFGKAPLDPRDRKSLYDV